MKRTAPFVLMLVLASATALASCSKPNPQATTSEPTSDQVASGDTGSNAASNAASGDTASGGQSSVATDKPVAFANKDTYVSEVKTELQSMSEHIQQLQSAGETSKGLSRLLKKQSAAQDQLKALEAANEDGWPQERRKMNRALTKLRQVYDKVEANQT